MALFGFLEQNNRGLTRFPDGEDESRVRNALLEIGRFVNHEESARLINTFDGWKRYWLAGAYGRKFGGLTVTLQRFYSVPPNPYVMLTGAYVLPQDLEAPSGEGKINFLELVAETSEEGHVLQMVHSRFTETRFYRGMFEQDEFWRQFVQKQGISLDTVSGALRGGLLCDIGVDGLRPKSDISMDVFPFQEISGFLQMIQRPDPAITAHMAEFYMMRNPNYAYERVALSGDSPSLLLP